MIWTINQSTPKGFPNQAVAEAQSERAMHLHSPAFMTGGTIPFQYTYDGDNVSPPLIGTAHRRTLSAMFSLLKTLTPPSDRSPIGLFITCLLIFNSCRKRLPNTLPFLTADYMAEMILVSWGLVDHAHLRDLTATCLNFMPSTNP